MRAADVDDEKWSLPEVAIGWRKSASQNGVTERGI